jgi:hypothetical protein
MFACKRNVTKEEANSVINNYFTAKYKRLISSGSGGQDFTGIMLANSTAKRVADKVDLFRKTAAALGLTAVNYKNTIVIDSTDFKTDTAKVYVKERLSITYLVKPGKQTDTISTIYINFYAFSLQQKSGKTVVVNEGLRSQDPLYISAKQHVNYVDTVQKPSAGIRLKNYAGKACANYALTYFSSPNPQYCNFDQKGGDCTNFAAQALVAGGWEKNSSWNAEGASCCKNILACSIQNCYTCSWTVAHEFYLYLPNSNRVIGNTTPDKLIPGDILQQDYNNDGHIDHTMVVTSKIGNEVFVTYRSLGDNTARKDISFKQIKGNLTAWRLKDKY